MANNLFSQETLELNGDRFVQINNDDLLYPKRDFVLSVDVYVDDWSRVVGNSIFGNFFGGGFSINYNNGIFTPIAGLLIDCTHNHLITINDQGEAIFQRSLNSIDPNVKIDSFIIDQNLIRYLVDNGNNSIYILDNENVLLNTLSLPTSSTINVMDNDCNGNIWFLDESTSTISAINALGESVSSVSVDDNHNNFTVMSDGRIISTCTNENTNIWQDCKGNYYHILGANLYKNGSIFYHVGGNVANLNIDGDDNIWIIYNNRILKIDCNGNFLLDKIFHELVPCSEDIVDCLPLGLQFYTEPLTLSFTRELSKSDPRGYVDTAWVLLSERNYLIQLTMDVEQIQCIYLPNVIDLNRFPDIDIANLNFCVRNDFTGYSTFKKCSCQNDAFMEGKFLIEESCTKNLQNVSLRYNASNLAKGWHHFAISYDGKEAKFFVDGVLVDSEQIFGEVFYRYEAPFLIGTESGKFRAFNQEIGLRNFVSFCGQIDNPRLYNNNLCDGDIKLLSALRSNYKDMVFEFELQDPIQYIEKVQTIFSNSLPYFKSKYFNIKIKGLNIYDEAAKELIETKIKQDLDKIKPAYTELNEIIWID